MPNLHGYTLTYDGVASTTIPEFICHQVTRQLLGERRHTIETVPGLEGAWIFPEQPGMKSVKIDASVLTNAVVVADRRAACRAVANWLEKSTPRKLIISDEPTRFLSAILSSSPDVDEWRQKGSFGLEFLAKPYAYDTTISTSTSSLSNFTVTAGGDVFTEPVIEVTAPVGGTGILGITINGRLLGYTTPIAAGNKITINCISKVITTGANIDTDINGTYNLTNLSMVGASGLFPYLLPGANNVDLSGTPGCTWVFKWRDRYR